MKTKPATSEIQSAALVEIEQRITERQAQIEKRKLAALDAVGSLIELAIEQGDDLIKAKKALGHGVFVKWLKKTFAKSYVTLTKYMLLSKKFKVSKKIKDADSLRQAYQLAGIIPDDDKKKIGSGDPVTTMEPIFQILGKFREIAGRDREQVMSWNSERKAQLKQDLQPIVELYGLL